jgi:hypothetical protein
MVGPVSLGPGVENASVASSPLQFICTYHSEAPASFVDEFGVLRMSALGSTECKNTLTGLPVPVPKMTTNSKLWRWESSIQKWVFLDRDRLSLPGVASETVGPIGPPCRPSHEREFEIFRVTTRHIIIAPPFFSPANDNKVTVSDATIAAC